MVAFLVAAGTADAKLLTVTSTADSGTGSLRDIVSTAASGDVVYLPASPVHYMVTSGEIAITANKNLTIRGAGADQSIIDGSDANRIFSTSGTTAFTVSRLAIAHGKVTGAPKGGGAIFADGSGGLIVSDSAFTHNSASASASGERGGGAIYDDSGSISIVGSTFDSNTLTVTGGSSGFDGGGAVYGSGSGLSITRSSFTANHVAVDATAALEGGGAVYNATGPLSITDSILTGNSVELGGPTIDNVGGGAIYQRSGTTFLSDSEVTANSATITSDNSVNGGGGVYQGGGFLNVLRSEVSGNTASVTGVGASDTNHGGGGVMNNGSGLSVADTSISGNRLTVTGGDGFNGGGGLYNNGGTLTLANSALDGNAATQGNGTQDGGGNVNATLGSGSSISSSTITGGSTDGAGGDVLFPAAAMPVSNSILAGGTAASAPNCSGSVTSLGHNIDSGTSCGFASAGDMSSTAPLLAPLGFNGGPTTTRMPLIGSPAIDHGSGCPLADQRGVSRPQGAACDIGAVEIEPPAVMTRQATAVKPASAALNADVVTRFAQTRVRFDYGTTTAYGKSSALKTVPGAAGTTSVSIPVGGLKPNTLYHFRAVALNASGVTVLGADRTLRTPPVPTPVVSNFKVVPKKFTPGPGASSFRFTLNEAATVRIKIFRLVSGKPPALKGTLTRSAKSGSNKISFNGKVGKKTLQSGKYRATITATTPGAVHASTPRSTGFTIL